MKARQCGRGAPGPCHLVKDTRLSGVALVTRSGEVTSVGAGSDSHFSQTKSTSSRKVGK